MSYQLRCRLAHIENPGKGKDPMQSFWLQQEPDKKSSFLFDSGTETNASSKMQKPCHLIVDCCSPEINESGGIAKQTVDWLFGGLEIHSNSRNIEVYAVPEGKNINGKEYWQTSRGSKITDRGNDDSREETNDCETELYQTIVLPPSSKATSVQSLHLKLLSIRPANCTIAFVKSIKLKGRIPEADPASSSINQVSTGGTSESNSSQKGSPFASSVANNNSNSHQVSTNMVATAISGLTMTINNARESMEASMQASIGEIQSLAFTQNDNFIGKLSLLEQSVDELKDSVVILKTNIDTWRKENEELQRKSCEKYDDVSSMMGETLDKEHIHKLLLKERQWVAEEMQKHKDEIISQVVDQVLSGLSNLERGAAPIVEVDNGVTVNENVIAGDGSLEENESNEEGLDDECRNNQIQNLSSTAEDGTEDDRKNEASE